MSMLNIFGAGLLGMALLALSASSPLAAASFSSSARGTSAASFLKLGAGARAAGMGEAYSALASDAGAMYWNPASLTRARDNSAAFTHVFYLISTAYDHVGYAKRFAGGTFGAGIQYFSAGDIIRTNAVGAETGEFSPNDKAFSLGYASRFRGGIAEGWAIGAAVKLVRLEIEDTATTWALDLGLLSKVLYGGRMRLTLTASNLGRKVRFGDEEERLPAVIRAGSSVTLLPTWAATADVSLPVDNAPYVSVGTEYILLRGSGRSLFLRAGFNSRAMDDLDGLSGFSAGTGVHLSRMGLDYAVLPFGALGVAHAISVSLGF